MLNQLLTPKFQPLNFEKGELHNSISLPTLWFRLNQLCSLKSTKEKKKASFYSQFNTAVYDWLQPQATSQELLSSSLALPLTFCVASGFLCCSSNVCTLTLQTGTCFVCAGFSQTQNSNWLWEPFLLCTEHQCPAKKSLPVSWYLVVFNCSNCQQALITHMHTHTRIRHMQTEKYAVSWKIDNYFKVS